MKQKKIEAKNITEGNEFEKLMKLVVIVSVIAILFYIVAIMVSNNRNKLKYQETKSDSQIVYDQILMSDTFHKGNEYYVLYTKKDNVFMTLYNSYITTYKAVSGSLPFYKADLSDTLNQSYIGEMNLTQEGFHLSDNSLLKISAGTVIESYIGNETIVNKLYEMGKTK